MAKDEPRHSSIAGWRLFVSKRNITDAMLLSLINTLEMGLNQTLTMLNGLKMILSILSTMPAGRSGISPLLWPS